MKVQNSMSECCKLCRGRFDRLAHSHIVPVAFLPKAEDKSRILLTAGGDGSHRKLAKGIWDEHILCDRCEHEVLGKYDQYAVRVWRDRERATWWTGRDGLRLAVFRGINRKLLRGFLASILWRYSVSEVEECGNVEIGKTYEERIARDLLHDGEFKYIDTIASFLTGEIFSGGFMTPGKIRIGTNGFGAINGYKMFLPRVEFLISLDQRPWELAHSRFNVDLDGEMVQGRMSLSSEYDLMPYFIPELGEGETGAAKTVKAVFTHYYVNKETYLQKKIALAKKLKQVNK